MVIIADDTALDYWRWVAASSSLRPGLCRHEIKAPSIAPEVLEVNDACNYFSQRGQLQVLVSDKGCRRQKGNVRYLLSQKIHSNGSLAKLQKDLYVISPPLLFVRMAKKLNFLETIALGYELTGTYVMKENDIVGFSKCDPLTTKRKICSFIERSEGIPGIKAARKAIPHVIENSASPMETNLAMRLSLPRRYGGYGLPHPELNVPIDASVAQKQGIYRHKVIVDLFWRNAKFALEYESNQWHEGANKFILDSKRRNDIRCLGYDITTITYDEYSNINSMNKLAHDIYRKIGVRERPYLECSDDQKAALKLSIDRLRNTIQKS